MPTTVYERMQYYKNKKLNVNREENLLCVRGDLTDEVMAPFRERVAEMLKAKKYKKYMNKWLKYYLQSIGSATIANRLIQEFELNKFGVKKLKKSKN